MVEKAVGPDDQEGAMPKEHTSELDKRAVNPVETVTVTSRAQAEKDKRNIKPLIVSSSLPQIGAQELKEAQKKDSTLRTQWEKTKQNVVFKTKGEGTYKFKVIDEVLYRIFQNKLHGEVKQIVVPEINRKQVMKLAHESIVGGHLGAKKTVDRITSNFHWPGVVANVTRFCRSCDICQKTAPKGRTCKLPLGEMPLMEEPFRRVAVDLVGPISPVSEKGNRYILTVVDFATRYPEAVALPKIETERVAEALLEVFSRVGFPKEMLSDRGTQFTSDLMKEVSRLVSTKQLFTTAYNPCKKDRRIGTGTYQQYFLHIEKYPSQTQDFLLLNFCMEGLSEDLCRFLKQLWTGDCEDEIRNTYQYVLELRNRLEETCQLARESLYEAQGRQKHHYDKKIRNRQFKVGQKVLVLLPTDSNKLVLQWKGPYEIKEVVNRMDYKVDIEGNHKILHANILTAYQEREASEVRTTVHEEECYSTTVIEEEGEGEVVIKDEGWLELRPNRGEETYKDVNICTKLSKRQKKQVWELLEEYQDILTSNPGKTSLGEHRIEVTTDQPVRTKAYPLPYAVRELIQKEVNEMLRMGIIEPSNSEYSSSVVMVKKKDGSNRFCVDYRKLNAVTKFDNEPMGDREALMLKLRNDKFFTKIDMSK